MSKRKTNNSLFSRNDFLRMDLVASCSKKNCNCLGRISLTELCGTVYNGNDSPLLFCEEHVLEMLYRYRLFKDREEEFLHYIKYPQLISQYYLWRATDLKIHMVLRHLRQILKDRQIFQSLIVCRNSSGHDYWLKKIEYAIAICEELTWHVVVRKQKKRKFHF